MKNIKTKSNGLAKRGTKSLLAAAMAMIATGGAYAQDTQIEEIVVTGTGTSIRGEAPVGQNLISIGREAIQESGAVSVQQILNDVPQITGFGNDGQSGYGASDGSGSYSPTIHSLGASASNSTLIVINGHRLPLTGISHNTGDPTIIPPAALERVEVLPDGASATYGSDAVAGVLNFITRKNVEGVEVSAQTGFADGNYKTANFNIVTGTSLGGGSVTAAYAYTYRSALANADRPWVRDDLSDIGGRNSLDDNCGPGATIDVGGGNGGKYLYPYAAANTIAAAGGNPCSTRGYTDLIGADLTHSVFMGYNQDFGDNAIFDMEMVYSQRQSDSTGSRGTRDISVDAADGNPFFVAAPNGDTAYTARWSATPWFGNGSSNTSGAETFMLSAGLDYDFTNGWFVNFGGTVGRNTSWRAASGSLCSDCLDDAVQNGIDVNGSLEYMDIWNPRSNSVDSRVISYILDNNSSATTVQTIVDLKVKMDGTVMTLPAGDLKVAFGANATQYQADYFTRGRTGTGPASSSSNTQDILITRDVGAVFAEALVPITERISFSAAVRMDEYSDFGSTTNPRLAAQWYPFDTDAIKVRASWAESFVAPALSSRGQTGTGLTTESGAGGGGFGSGTIDRNFSDPRTDAFLDWMGANFASECTFVGAVATECEVGSNNGPTAGWITGGNDDLQPATGETWSVGVDINNPDWLPGLRVSATYYDALLNQMITAPRLNNILEVPALNSRLVLLPTLAEWNDWTAGLPQTRDMPSGDSVANLPPGAFLGWMWSFQQINAFNIDSAGIDLTVDYSWETDMGNWDLSYAGNKKTRFDQQAGTGGAWVDYLNTDANTTFSSMEYLQTLALGWSNESASAKVTWKHQNGYDVNVNRSESVDAMDSFNFYASYNFNFQGLLSDGQVFLQMQNVLDERPPEVASQNGGYNSSDSSPLGRLTTIGFRKTF